MFFQEYSSPLPQAAVAIGILSLILKAIEILENGLQVIFQTSKHQIFLFHQTSGSQLKGDG